MQDADVACRVSAAAAPLRPMTCAFGSELIAGPSIRVKRARHGLVLYHPHDRQVGRSLDLYGEYSHAETEVFARIAKPGMTVVDAGAHIGAHSLMLAQAVGSSGLVIALEPQRVLHQMLCANLAFNEIAHVRTLQMAAGREAGEAFVPLIDYASPGDFGSVALTPDGGGERVMVVPIDDIGLGQCQLMKVDAEGMEEEVILGARETILRHRPVLYVANGFRERSPPLIRRLLDMGYALQWHLPPLFSAANFYQNPHDAFAGAVSINMLCMPRESSPTTGIDEIEDPQDWPVVSVRAATGLRALGWASQVAAATRCSEPIPEAQRGDPDVLHRHALRSAQAGDHAQALTLIEAAIRITPTNGPADAELLSDYGLALHRLGRHDEAVAAFDRALMLSPELFSARRDRGHALLALDRPQQALASFDAALAVERRDPETLCHRGDALLRLGRIEEAIEAYEAALEVVPPSPKIFSALYRGDTLRHLGRPDLALASAEKALAIDPAHAGAHCERALAALTLGDFATGWASYEWRWKTPEFAPRRRGFSQPLWLGGEAISGRTILLHAEQGFGDTLQFVRYAPLVAQLGAKVVLEVQAELVPLLTRMPEVAGVVARGDPLPAFDLHSPQLSLPLAFGTRLETIPAACPYLSAPEERVAAWRARLPASRLRVGLAWSGLPSHCNDHHRSIGLAPAAAADRRRRGVRCPAAGDSRSGRRGPGRAPRGDQRRTGIA